MFCPVTFSCYLQTNFNKLPFWLFDVILYNMGCRNSSENCNGDKVCCDNGFSWKWPECVSPSAAKNWPHPCDDSASPGLWNTEYIFSGPDLVIMVLVLFNVIIVCGLICYCLRSRNAVRAVKYQVVDQESDFEKVNILNDAI